MCQCSLNKFLTGPLHSYTLTVSKNLIPYSSANFWPLDVGTAYKRRYIMPGKKYSQNMFPDKFSFITLLLSSMSALLPTNILFTLSEACCSMFPIQFLMSTQILDQGSYKCKASFIFIFIFRLI